MDHLPFWLKLIGLAAVAIYRTHPVSRKELIRLARTATSIQMGALTVAGVASLKWKRIFMRKFFYVFGYGVFLPACWLPFLFLYLYVQETSEPVFSSGAM